MHNSILLLIALATAMLAAHAAASQADVDRLTTAATAVLLRTRGEIEIAVFTLSQGPRFDLETPDLTATLTSEITESGNTSEAHAFFDSWDVETAAAIARVIVPLCLSLPNKLPKAKMAAAA